MKLSEILSTVQKLISLGKKDEVLEYLHENHEEMMKQFSLSKQSIDIMHGFYALYESLGDTKRALEISQRTISYAKQISNYKLEKLVAMKCDCVRLCMKLDMSAEAISTLKDIVANYQSVLDSNRNTHIEILKLLASLYTQQGNRKESVVWHQKCIDLIESTNDDFFSTSNALSFHIDENDAAHLSSLYLGIGADYTRMEEYEKANEAYQIGYFIAYKVFGKSSEKTLKIEYNMIINELVSSNPQEGYRQLKLFKPFCIKALGEDHCLSQTVNQSLLNYSSLDHKTSNTDNGIEDIYTVFLNGFPVNRNTGDHSPDSL